jgi:hypothetical protein
MHFCCWLVSCFSWSVPLLLTRDLVLPRFSLVYAFSLRIKQSHGWLLIMHLMVIRLPFLGVWLGCEGECGKVVYGLVLLDFVCLN